MSRPVTIFKWQDIKWHDKEDPKRANSRKRVVIGKGEFLAFGLDYQLEEEGIGHASTAIVEMPEGFVENVPLDLIQFEVIETGLQSNGAFNRSDKSPLRTLKEVPSSAESDPDYFEPD